MCSDPVDIDLFGQTFEVLWTKAFERQARSGREIAHRATCQHFVGPGHRAYPCPDMDGHATPFVSAFFALPDVDPRAYPDAPRRQGWHELEPAPGRLRRTVEKSEYAVPVCLARRPPYFDSRLSTTLSWASSSWRQCASPWALSSWVELTISVKKTVESN